MDGSDGHLSEEEFVINRSPDNSPRALNVSDGEIEQVEYLPDDTPLLSDDDFDAAIAKGPQIMLKDGQKLGMDWPRQTDERVENGYYRSGIEFHRTELEQAVERQRARKQVPIDSFELTSASDMPPPPIYNKGVHMLRSIFDTRGRPNTWHHPGV